MISESERERKQENMRVKWRDIEKARETLENEYDNQIEKVIESTKKPGCLGEKKIRARSAKIDNIRDKLEQVERKSRTLSAHRILY